MRWIKFIFVILKSLIQLIFFFKSKSKIMDPKKEFGDLFVAVATYMRSFLDAKKNGAQSFKDFISYFTDGDDFTATWAAISGFPNVGQVLGEMGKGDAETYVWSRVREVLPEIDDRPNLKYQCIRIADGVLAAFEIIKQGAGDRDPVSDLKGAISAAALELPSEQIQFALPVVPEQVAKAVDEPKEEPKRGRPKKS